MTFSLLLVIISSQDQQRLWLNLKQMLKTHDQMGEEKKRSEQLWNVY